MGKALYAAICVVMVSGAAVAQDFPKVEIFGGYSMTNIGGDAGDVYDAWDRGLPEIADSWSTMRWFQKGFNVSAAFNVNRYFGIEAGFYFNSENMAEFTASIGGTDDRGKQNGKLLSFMAGPRFAYRGHESLTPFAHFLVGMNRFSLNYEASCTSDGENCTAEFVDYIRALSDGLFFVDDSDTGFAFALGGGLDAGITDGFAVRVIQVDYVKSFHGDDGDDFNLDNVNLSFGVVFRFGK